MSGWIDKRARMPRPEDCDEQKCILAWHKYSGAGVVSLHNFEQYGRLYTHWMRLPAAPDAEKLWN